MLTAHEIDLARQSYGAHDLPDALLKTLSSMKMAYSRVIAANLTTEMIVCAVGSYGAIATKVRPPSPWDSISIGTPLRAYNSSRTSVCEATFQGRCNTPDDEFLLIDMNGDPESRRKVYHWNCSVIGRVPLARTRFDEVTQKDIELPQLSDELRNFESIGEAVIDPASSDELPVEPIEELFKNGDAVFASTDSGVIAGVFGGLSDDGQFVDVIVDGVPHPVPACDVIRDHGQN